MAMKSGAFDYITKPFNVDEIKTVIKAALKKKTHSETQPASGFSEIIGQSPEMMKIFDLITKIAPTPANVLIYGESGTGKELVAKAIHNRSRVAANPFVPITCSAIPKVCWRASYSAISKDRSPARSPTRPACSSWPTAAPPSSTRLAN